VRRGKGFLGSSLSVVSCPLSVPFSIQRSAFSIQRLVAALPRCEVQGRSELEHVWATKSHNLLYKTGSGWDFRNNRVIEEMRQVSNILRGVDQFLVNIRHRVRRKRHYES